MFETKKKLEPEKGYGDLSQYRRERKEQAVLLDDDGGIDGAPLYCIYEAKLSTDTQKYSQNVSIFFGDK